MLDYDSQGVDRPVRQDCPAKKCRQNRVSKSDCQAAESAITIQTVRTYPGGEKCQGRRVYSLSKIAKFMSKTDRGSMRPKSSFKTSCFRLKSISHAKELNSGFFFRALAGTEEAPSHGYEYQIHNGFDPDRSHPNNAGTGAIFRRVDARYVVANDQEWFTATLVAHGPRICCWVDGYQVVDWVDERAT